MRRRGLKMLVSCLFLIALTIMGTILPSRLFEAEDERRREQNQSYEMEPLVIQKTNSVPLNKKFELLYSDSMYIQGMAVSSSPEERTRIKELMEQEVRALVKAGALPGNLKFQKNGTINEEDMKKCFLIDTSNPETSVYVWVVRMFKSAKKKKAYGQLSVVMDDETGKIFVMQMYSNKNIKWEQRLDGFMKYISQEVPVYQRYFEEYMKELEVFYDTTSVFTTISESMFGYTVLHMENIQDAYTKSMENDLTNW